MDGWNTISWKKVERGVLKLQKRIDRAQCRGNVRRVRSLQRLLRKSRSARLLAGRRVPQDNQGKKTAGVDGRKSLTPDQRWALVNTLSLYHETQPVRRVWIPKPATDEKRPLGIPTIFDRALQALVNMALEPQWEARFEPNSDGFRPGRSVWEAIGAIYVGINQKPQRVLDADLAKCLDRIDHEALRRKIHAKPTIRRQSKAWLKAGVVDNGELFPTEAGTPQGGTVTPPTKLQTFFFGVRIARIRIDPQHNIDLSPGHVHSLDQRPDAVALARPVSGLPAVMELGRTVFKTANNQLPCPLQGGLIRQRWAWLLQPGETLTQTGNPGLKLRFVKKPRRLAIDQPCDALAQLADLLCNGRQRRVLGACLWLQTAPLVLRAPLRMSPPQTDGLPHGQVQEIGPHLRILAEALPPEARRIGPQAAGVGRRAGLALPGAWAQAFPIEGIATGLALEQALPQGQRPTARLPRVPLMLAPLVLDGRKPVGLHDRGPREGAPVLARDVHRGDRPARRPRAPTLRPQPGAERLLTRLPKGGGAHRGRMPQHAPDGAPIPHRLARPCPLTGLGETAAYLPNRQTQPGRSSQTPGGSAGLRRGRSRPGPVPRPHTARYRGTHRAPRSAQ